jgi:hypothetical protein
MDKGIGFNRNIKLDWLEAAAAFCAETAEPTAVRERLVPIIGQEIKSQTNIRKAIDILLHIWLKSGEGYPRLYQTALHHFGTTQIPADRLWLHYGLTLLAYPFFWQAVTAVGQLARYEETITTTAVRHKLYAALGQLGSVEEATSRVIFSLRDWGILQDAPQRNQYIPQYRHFATANPDLERWLLACALQAHPGEQLPFADLLHLPALFPFQFTVTVYDLRQSDEFVVQRQGSGLDMVRRANGQG